MNTFHEGEIAVQKRAGEEQIAGRNGKIIANRILPGAVPFLAQQRMMLFGTRDSDGAVWASLLFGEAGFVKASDAQTVVIDLKRVLSQDPRDRFWSNAHGPVGMLAIDLATRKRYRINGTMRREAETLVLRVDEAYPNCPKYISQRIVERASLPVREFLATTDVFFVASAHPDGGADVSHRGGPEGFVKGVDEKTLRIPDYPGNGMFNTLGNLVADPHAGLLFPDFSGGRMLQLTGTAEIEWDQTDGSGETNRYWKFYIDQWIELEGLAL